MIWNCIQIISIALSCMRIKDILGHVKSLNREWNLVSIFRGTNHSSHPVFTSRLFFFTKALQLHYQDVGKSVNIHLLITILVFFTSSTVYLVISNKKLFSIEFFNAVVEREWTLFLLLWILCFVHELFNVNQSLGFPNHFEIKFACACKFCAKFFNCQLIFFEFIFIWGTRGIVISFCFSYFQSIKSFSSWIWIFKISFISNFKLILARFFLKRI